MLFRVFIFLLQKHNSKYEARPSDLLECEEETIAIIVVAPKQTGGVYLARDQMTFA